MFKLHVLSFKIFLHVDAVIKQFVKARRASVRWSIKIVKLFFVLGALKETFLQFYKNKTRYVTFTASYTVDVPDVTHFLALQSYVTKGKCVTQGMSVRFPWDVSQNCVTSGKYNTIFIRNNTIFRQNVCHFRKICIKFSISDTNGDVWVIIFQRKWSQFMNLMTFWKKNGNFPYITRKKQFEFCKFSFSLKTCVTKGKCVTLGMSKMCHLGYVYCILSILG